MMSRFRTIFVRKKTGPYNYVDEENSDGLITELMEEENAVTIQEGRIQLDESATMEQENFETIGFRSRDSEGGGRGSRIVGGTTVSFSKLEKKLMFIIAILGIVFIVAIVVGSLNCQNDENGKSNNGSNTEVCLTRTCVKVAEKMIRSMNESANPCDNFYEFACGGWINNHELTGKDDRFNIFVQMENSKNIAIKRILERKTPTTAPYEDESRKLYDLCLDMATINKRGSSPMRDFLSQLGDMPVLGSWDETKFDFGQTQKNFSLKDIFPFFKFIQTINVNNSKEYLLEVEQPTLFLTDYENKPDELPMIVESRLVYMTDTLMLLGAKNRSSTTEQMNQVLQLEQKLGNISISAVQQRFEKFKCERLDRLHTFFSPAIEWKELITYVYNKTANVTIHPNETVCTSSLEYLNKLESVIKNTPNRTLMNYMMWRAVENYEDYLNDSFLDVKAKFLKKVTGANKLCSHRWMQCVSYVTQSYYIVISNIYVGENFRDTTSKNVVNNMVLDMKNAFKENLNSMKWMNSNIRKLTSEKVDAMKSKVGYTERLFNNTFINNYYKGMEVSTKGFFEKMILANLLSQKRKFSQFYQQVVEINEEWMIDINAYFSPTENAIDLPAGILQSPMFEEKAPSALTYGGIGVAVGHELTHGFDDQGVKYDKNGNQRMWWDNATFDEFNKLKICMEKQYSKYMMLGKHINGNLTIGENIADNGGLRIAYQAYRKRIKEKRSRFQLPSMERYTPDQLFFISTAQTWCSIATDQAVVKQILTDPHTPAKYRVIGMLSNFQQFSDAFQCSSGSPMNPSEKCHIW